MLQLLGATKPAHTKPPQMETELGHRFIRIVEAKKSEWDNTTGDSVVLAGELFSRVEDEGVSVFMVRSDAEELAAVVARQMTKGNVQKDPVNVLRIRPSEIQSIGIRAIETRGETGVAQVDAWHRDLKAPLDHYANLARMIMSDIRDGGDRIRRIPRAILLLQLQRFSGLPEGAISADRLRQCKRLLSDNHKNIPGPIT